MSSAPHIVRSARSGKPVIWYVYAWRGGPQIHKVEGGARPKLTDAIRRAIAEAWRGRSKAPPETIAGLITDYRSSPEWMKLSRTTTATWIIWLDRIRDEFGKAPLAAFEDRRMRGEVLKWRDRWAHQPRSADMAMQVFSRLLSWGFDRGRLGINVVAGVASLYDADRSDIIWTEQDLAAFAEHASPEVMEAVELAACTGLRRGDLVKLPWSAIGDHAIIWKTGKSRGKAQVVIPLLPETRALLKRIKNRFAADMAKRRRDKRKPMPETVLSSSYARPWTPSGFGSRFNDAKQASGVQVNLHDLRGTFATRCMMAGLTDDQIADILGWTAKEVATIRVKYVDQARVVVAIGERIAATSVKRL